MQVFRSQRVDLLKVAPGVLQVSNHRCDKAQPGGNPGGRLARLDFADKGEVARLVQFGLRKSGFGILPAGFKDCGLGCRRFTSLTRILDEEQARIGGIPHGGGDPVDQTEFLAQALPQAAAVAGSDDRRDNIKGR